MGCCSHRLWKSGGRAQAAPGSGAPAAAPCCLPPTSGPTGRPCWRAGCPGPPCPPCSAQGKKRKDGGLQGTRSGLGASWLVWVPGFRNSQGIYGSASGRRVGLVGAAERGFRCKKLGWLCIAGQGRAHHRSPPVPRGGGSLKHLQGLLGPHLAFLHTHLLPEYTAPNFQRKGSE